MAFYATSAWLGAAEYQLLAWASARGITLVAKHLTTSGQEAALTTLRFGRSRDYIDYYDVPAARRSQARTEYGTGRLP